MAAVFWRIRRELTSHIASATQWLSSSLCTASHIIPHDRQQVMPTEREGDASGREQTGSMALSILKSGALDADDKAFSRMVFQTPMIKQQRQKGTPATTPSPPTTTKTLLLHTPKSFQSPACDASHKQKKKTHAHHHCTSRVHRGASHLISRLARYWIGVLGVARCMAPPTPPPCVSTRSSTKGNLVSTSGRPATLWRLFLKPAGGAAAAAVVAGGAVDRPASTLC